MRQKEYEDRNRKKGLARTTVWVPAEYQQALKDYAKQLREHANR